MQAGRQRGALPLIRKFNEHSERLLNSALRVVLYSACVVYTYLITGAKVLPQSDSERTLMRFVHSTMPLKLPHKISSQREIEGIDIEDLHNPEAFTGIALEMQDSQRYFEGRMKEGQEDISKEVIWILRVSGTKTNVT